MEMSRVIFFSYIYRAIDKLYFQKSTVLVHFLKTYAAISNAHLSRVCKRGKLSGSCLSTLKGRDSVPPGREIITCMSWSVGVVGGA